MFDGRIKLLTNEEITLQRDDPNDFSFKLSEAEGFSFVFGFEGTVLPPNIGTFELAAKSRINGK
jgi:hypothetical protein